jgi:hypothetical protein
VSAGRFWSYTPDGDGFVRHDTEEAARAAALTEIGLSRSSSRDGEWRGDETLICWGEVREECGETHRRVLADELEGVTDPDEIQEIRDDFRGFDHMYDIELLPVPE